MCLKYIRPLLFIFRLGLGVVLLTLKAYIVVQGLVGRSDTLDDDIAEFDDSELLKKAETYDFTGHEM